MYFRAKGDRRTWQQRTLFFEIDINELLSKEDREVKPNSTWFVSIHVWGCHLESGIPVNNGPASRIPLNFELESRILIDKKRRKTPLELPMHTFNNANIHLVWLCDSPVNMIYIYYKYLAKSIRYVNRWQNVCALPKSLIDKPKLALLRKFRN